MTAMAQIGQPNALGNLDALTVQLLQDGQLFIQNIADLLNWAVGLLIVFQFVMFGYKIAVRGNVQIESLNLTKRIVFASAVLYAVTNSGALCDQVLTSLLRVLAIAAPTTGRAGGQSVEHFDIARILLDGLVVPMDLWHLWGQLGAETRTLLVFPVALAAFCLTLMVAIVVAQVVFVQAQVYLLLLGGIAVSVFSVNQYTAGFARGFFIAAVQSCLRIAVVYILLGVIQRINTSWIGLMRDMAVQDLLQIMPLMLVVHFVITALMWHGPKLASVFGGREQNTSAVEV